MNVTPAECAGLEVLGELEPALLAQVAAQCRVVTVAAQETILRQGAPNDQVHFLLSGLVHLYFDDVTRSQPIEIEAGRMFGEMSVIDDLPASAFIIAAERCRLVLLPADVFWSEVVPAPGIARAVMRSISRRIRSDSMALLRAMQDRIRHAALEQELRLARQIQMGMLRRVNPWFPDRRDFAIFARIEPAKAVGGDFYDAFLLDSDHLVLAIGDAAGKGVSAALFMVRALTLLRSAAVNWVSLADMVGGVNRTLADDNEASMFLTLFMAVLELRTGTLEYINFGHLPPLIRSPDGSVAHHPLSPGVMFGLMEGAEGATGSLVLAPGSTLVLYSDGVTEAEAPDQRQFGLDGLLAAAGQADTSDPEGVVGRIAAAVTDHAGTAEQADDITILAVTYHGSRTPD
ncbi:MAG: SpoIIE family protein phosphatase [Acetobacteraceae bacterium]|jgi:sigma-B regulation protein RsbU (phosphoserine phosphatase)